MDDITRGRILRMIETELEKPILSRIEWVEMPISTNLALGYMLGLLEEKAENLKANQKN